MIISDYQRWIGSKGMSITVDGMSGPATRTATMGVFVNLDARPISDRQVSRLATFCGCSYEQIMAVANVESGGSGYDAEGRPKILFERHKFHGFTGGQWSVASYSNPDAGGYSESSWDKLTLALGKDVDVAFKSASWGKFQVMGYWFADMGFASPLDLAYATVRSEFWHYVLFAAYIMRIAKLDDALRKVSTNPDDCRDFAKGYNGSGYESGGYHTKIAEQMQLLTEDSIEI